jgi:hypothetical protein
MVEICTLRRGGILINSVAKFHSVVCTVHDCKLVQHYARSSYTVKLYSDVSVTATTIFREDNTTDQNLGLASTRDMLTGRAFNDLRTFMVTAVTSITMAAVDRNR